MNAWSKLLSSAVVSGVLAHAAVASADSHNKAAKKGKNAAAEGKNECKGKDGCKGKEAGKNECKGKSECKGKDKAVEEAPKAE